MTTPARLANDESAAHLKAVLETVIDGIITIDTQGSIATANPAAERIFGYRAEELWGKNVNILMPAPDRDLHDGYLQNYLSTGRKKIIGIGREVAGLRKDGSTFPMELAVSEMWVGGQRMFTGIVRDITERKRVEQALVAAKNAAELANRAKDSFLATMSHEIRTPLGGLLGMLELLGLTPLNQDQSDALKTAHDSGRSLLRILNDILDWSKIEAGKLDLAPQATSVRALVAGVVNTYARVASANSLILEQQVDERLSPALVVDPLRLSQVLNNFVSNALKFTQRGHVLVRAELLDKGNGAERVRFSVKDTGAGIEESVQQRLFQDYGQQSAETARLYGGTGLGLAICRRLAEMMDGRITLESAPGQGSTFSLTLTLPVADTAPVRQARSPAVAARSVSVRPLVPAAARADALCVLIVDDHPTNRKLLAIQLGLLGLRSQAAENGNAAVEMWRKGRFDLVITDCHMPGMDGYELTQAIRTMEADAGRTRTPVFAWTANALAEEWAHCRAAGMDELLVKPADLAQLRSALSRWLPLVDAEANSSDPPRTTDSPPVDVRVLERLVGNDPKAIREFLQEFGLVAARVGMDMRVAVEAGDAAAVVAAAHMLKSSARAVGALALGELCAQMETQGEAGASAALAALFARFEAELAAAQRHLASR